MGEQAEASLLRGSRLGVVPDSFVPVGAGSLRPVPRGLRLDRVARSHGWIGLPPFGYDADNNHLFITLTLDHAPATTRVDASWAVTADRGLSAVAIAELLSTLRWCLGIDDDMTGAPGSLRATRMLRSATVWEDLVKTLMTTNCSWSATVGMVSRLVETFGTAGTFPAPEIVAAAGAEPLRELVRMGYRAKPLARLAESIATGALDPQRWRDRHVPDEQILASVMALPGFGLYSAEGMLGLLGRPRGLAVDSWIRARLGGLSAPEITERYSVHGRWAGAVLWHDVTAHWFAA